MYAFRFCRKAYSFAQNIVFLKERRGFVQSIGLFIVAHMAYFVLGAGGVAVAAPDVFRWVVPHIPLLLGAVMFGMGMTLRVSDLRAVAACPRAVGIGILLQFTIMPLAAWGS